LLFEEPELFLHPDAQKILFDALSVVSKEHHVVVTTHSPLFLGPDSTATFVRLTKESADGTPKPFTKAHPVDLTGIRPKDEFQIICFENNNAAFFAKKVVLVEGDSDLIVFPHIAETLEPRWTCRAQSVAFVRISGKGSISRYRNFFARFGSPVFVITDLDTLDDGFDKLEPDETIKDLRNDLMQKVDNANAAAGLVQVMDIESIRSAQANPEIRRLWNAVRIAKAAYDIDNTKLPELEVAVETFFAWEKKNIRRECICKAEQPEVFRTKLALIWELRKKGIFVLERGCLDDYYPESVTGADKPSRAQAFRRTFTSREQLLPLSPQQTCPNTARVASEFEFICSAIFS
jgi:predicted ATP-dependent endonuclease of OLD family